MKKIEFLGRSYNAAELSREQLSSLSSTIECERQEASEEIIIPSGYELYEITGRGTEPLGEIHSVLKKVGYDPLRDGSPSDTGYDTDIDRVGFNSVFALVPEE